MQGKEVWFSIWFSSFFPFSFTVYSHFVRVCVNLKKEKSQGKAVEVTVNSKEDFVWISSQNSASGYRPVFEGGGVSGGEGGSVICFKVKIG